MAFFYSKACQTEKAFRALFCLQGKGNWENSFVSNDSRERIIPNRTFVASAFTPTRPYRPEGMVFLEIQHHFPAVIQPNEKNTLGQVDWNAQQRLIGRDLRELSIELSKNKLLLEFDCFNREITERFKRLGRAEVFIPIDVEGFVLVSHGKEGLR